MALIRGIKGVWPTIADSCFVAENATITGDVTLMEESSVWYNAVLRGDVGSITIGKQSNIQDNAMVHATLGKSKTVVGNNVTVGHQATLHGCTVEDGALIGMGAIVLDNAVVGKGTVVAAGAVVLENSILEPGSIYAGIPAKLVKRLSPEALEQMKKTSLHYIDYAKWIEKE